MSRPAGDEPAAMLADDLLTADARQRAEAPHGREGTKGGSLGAHAIATLSEAARVRLAADTGITGAVLTQLAFDSAVMVRATLAMNPRAIQAGGMHAGAAPALLQQIARDPDDRVRALLAQRLAQALPDTALAQRDALQDEVMATLFLLAADEAVRVRSAIAEVVKDMPGVPHALVLHLAQDLALCVCEPVIRLSPLLTTDDLLTLVADASGPATAMAVARRPGLAAKVADAIAAGADTTAIAALIANPSACISEATLDRLVQRAAEQVAWHQPLVRRPALSHRAVQALAEFVADQLLAELARRTDLPPRLTHDIGQKLLRHLAAQNRHVAASSGLSAIGPDHADTDACWHQALQMDRAGMLTEDAVIGSARAGEATLCACMLAVAARVPLAVVDHARALRSAKGLVSLAWQAGFSMRAAGPMQTLLGRLAPDTLLQPADGGWFPLTEAEMRWQIAFLTRIGRHGAQPV